MLEHKREMQANLDNQRHLKMHYKNVKNQDVIEVPDTCPKPKSDTVKERSTLPYAQSAAKILCDVQELNLEFKSCIGGNEGRETPGTVSLRIEHHEAVN